MTFQTFAAFGVQRTSDQDRHWASQDAGGTVRFHASQGSAKRAAGRFGHVAQATVTAGRAKRAARVCTACQGTGTHRVNCAGHAMDGQDVACFTCCGSGK